MALQCLVYGKNAGVVVFYGWVAWRRDWEGNGLMMWFRFAMFEWVAFLWVSVYRGCIFNFNRAWEVAVKYPASNH
ncbi:hypothetical protein NC652_031205 [Populus alba x Populus x berolinensis]|nr:hypothetical protein NC652_031205 [Populus alba x Populus x berolinensis]